jgi:hypothetical protein
MTTEVPSTFSLEAFQGATFEGEEGDTRYAPPIEAKEYLAMIKGPYNDPKATRLRQEKGYLIFDVVYEVDDPDQLRKLGFTKLPGVRQSIFLDLTEQGGLDMGPYKNGELNRLREAVGLKVPGQRWGFADFVGKPARIKVGHRPDKDNPQRTYTEVREVTKA